MLILCVFGVTHKEIILPGQANNLPNSRLNGCQRTLRYNAFSFIQINSLQGDNQVNFLISTATHLSHCAPHLLDCFKLVHYVFCAVCLQDSGQIKFHKSNEMTNGESCLGVDSNSHLVETSNLPPVHLIHFFHSCSSCLLCSFVLPVINAINSLEAIFFFFHKTYWQLQSQYFYQQANFLCSDIITRACVSRASK